MNLKEAQRLARIAQAAGNKTVITYYGIGRLACNVRLYIVTELRVKGKRCPRSLQCRVNNEEHLKQYLGEKGNAHITEH